jgi:VIT1/CCC1 family predicted Fe2+/Mn2+ transporter
MPQTPHVEKHFTASEAVRDIVIGMSDGLTVPFALAAGLSGAVEATTIIITAGLAEVAAGAIAMGLGGYLAARTDAEHFASERAREERETKEMPETEAAEVADVFRSYGLNDDTVATVVNAIRADRRRWVDFMMRFELSLWQVAPQPGGPKKRWRAVALASDQRHPNRFAGAPYDQNRLVYMVHGTGLGFSQPPRFGGAGRLCQRRSAGPGKLP